MTESANIDSRDEDAPEGKTYSARQVREAVDYYKRLTERAVRLGEEIDKEV